MHLSAVVSYFPYPVTCMFWLLVKGASVVHLPLFFFFLMIRHPPRSPLFPYPPLSRPPRRSADRPPPGRRVDRAPGPAPRAARDAHEAARRPRGGAVVPARRVHGPALDHERAARSEEHTSELQSRSDIVCRLLLEKKKK